MRHAALAALALLVASSAALAEPGQLAVPGDYPTIQAAIDAAQPGDTVRVQPGSYDENLTLKSGVTLEGAGRDSVTVRGPVAGSPLLLAEGCTSGTVRGISFELTGLDKDVKLPEEPAAVLRIVDSSLDVDNCAVRGSGGNGIQVRGNGTCAIRDCAVSANRAVGISVTGPATANILNNTVTANKTGICLTDRAAGSVEGNQVTENAANGILIGGEGTQPALKNNTASKNGRCGISYTKGAAGVAIGNRCEQNEGSGIAVGGGTSPELRGNTLLDNRWYGFWFEDNNKARISGNDYTRNGQINYGEAMRLFYADQFDDIETIAARLRKDRAKTYHGECQLATFYDGLTAECAQREEKYLARMEKWRKAKPDSVTRLTALAKAHISFAWRERGGGWASEVTPKGWEGFHEYLNKAVDIVAEAEKLPDKDPELYMVKCVLLRGLGKNAPVSTPLMTMASKYYGVDLSVPGEAQTAFDKGVTVDPTYFPLYYERCEALLPRWGGSPAELTSLADQAARRAVSSEGESLYARIATRVFYREGADDYARRYNFAWPRIKQGYRELLERYPGANWRLNMFCRLACVYGDRDTAADLFDKIGKDWDADVWKEETEFKQWKRWAADKDSGR